MVPHTTRDDEVEVFCREAELTRCESKGKIERSADASKDCHILFHDASHLLEALCFPLQEYKHVNKWVE